jgi:hypothetical protein
VTIEQAAPQLDSLRQQIYALCDRIPLAETYPVYKALAKTSNILVLSEKVAALRDIVATLKGKVS